MMGARRVNVLVVGYNSGRWLDRCLSTLACASRRIRLCLCFVDNHNNPEFTSLDLSAFETEVLRTPEPLGFAQANNFAIQQTRILSDFTVFLNQDTVSTDGWIDRCIECFDRNDRLGVLSPGLRTYDLTEWEPNLAACVRESAQTLEAVPSELLQVRAVTAAAMIVRTKLLDQAGPFDPIFDSYYEDFDLCRRVRNAGYTVGVCPGAWVGHFSGSVTSTPSAIERRSRTLIRNRLIHELRENPERRQAVLLRHLLVALPINLVRGLLRTASSQSVSATLGAHWDLIRIGDRLLSASRDEKLWKQFLAEFRSQMNTPVDDRDR